MGQQVCGGAMTQCTFGVAPGTLMVLPLNLVMTGMPAANIMDNKPMVNVMPFVMCQSMANPMVAAATAAALGVQLAIGHHYAAAVDHRSGPAGNAAAFVGRVAGIEHRARLHGRPVRGRRRVRVQQRAITAVDGDLRSRDDSSAWSLATGVDR